jgi:dihydroorotate dehydrogenase
MIYSLIRPLLFTLPAEAAHKITLRSLSLLHSTGLYPRFTTHQAPQNVMGLQFPNAVGLGAGLDKNGAHINALAALGFGFIEVGTVTPRPQAGNPKPRLFRIPQAEGIINRMGFNNCGVDALIENVQQAAFKGILGINIGKNAATPLENAADDYLICLNKVYPYASYITVNISSPNTPGLRQLQQSDDLNTLLGALKQAQKACAIQHKKYVPLVVKISPDLNTAEIKSVAENLLVHQIDGVIATNTTLSRAGVESLPSADEKGGLSGKPLFQRSLSVVRTLNDYLKNEIPIIACGGISSKEQAQQMYAAGARLIQIYSAFIYQGPELIKQITSK